MGFPCGLAGKESAYSVGDLGSIPGLGRSLEEGKGDPFQYSDLENSMECIVHGVSESDTTEQVFTYKCLMSGMTRTLRAGGERKGYPLWYSGLENSMNSIVHGVTKSWI